MTTSAAAGDLRWALLGSVIPAALAVATNVLLVRALGIEDFGEWVYFTQVAGYVSAVLLGLVTFTLAYHLPRGQYDGRDLLRATGVSALAIGVAGAALSALLAPLALATPNAATIAIGMSIVPVMAAQFWAFSALDSMLAFRRRASLAVIAAALSLIGVLVLLAAGTLSPVTGIAVRLAAVALSVGFAWWIVRDIVPRAASRLPLLRVLRFVATESWPVTLSSLVGAVAAAVVLVAIGIFGGQDSLGAAGVGFLLAQPITLLSVALSAVLLPHGAREPGTRGGLRRLGLLVSVFSLVYAVGITWQGQALMELITGTVPSETMVAVAILLLWGAWFRQVSGVDVVILRSNGRVMEGLLVALVGALPIVPVAWLAGATLVHNGAVAIALAWAACQGAGMLLAAIIIRRPAREPR